MANKADFKTVETSREELEELNEKIRMHRHKTIRHVICAVVILVAVVLGVQLWSALRSYSSFEVISSVDRQDSAAAKYEPFPGNILEYNKDGVVCRSVDDELAQEHESFQYLHHLSKS